ncbi:MAG TPA: hypothetical protein VMV48_13545 [Gallionellaceae bacterium]|nr:hypothetical protein [Gallionellaceae bacterium]
MITVVIVMALIQLIKNLLPLILGGVYWMLRERDDRLEAMTTFNSSRKK